MVRTIEAVQPMAPKKDCGVIGIRLAQLLHRIGVATNGVDGTVWRSWSVMLVLPMAGCMYLPAVHISEQCWIHVGGEVNLRREASLHTIFQYAVLWRVK